MFTGLILESVSLKESAPRGLGKVFQIEAQHPRFRDCELGASVALNGACLTVVKKTLNPDSNTTLLEFELSPETLACTQLGDLKSGALLHAELALRAGDPLGGHIVSGHVDAVGFLKSKNQQGEYWDFIFGVENGAQKKIAPFLVPKGSICVSGVSLTVNEVWDEGNSSFFRVTLIPHTLEICGFGTMNPGSRVNLEADMIAKYSIRHHNFFAANTSKD